MNPEAGKFHEKGEILRDVIYAANDGIITTFAVVAGVAGGSLSASIVLILGFANLFADGFSMAVSSYLGTKSEKDFLQAENDAASRLEKPVRNSIVTFFSFVIAGAIPVFSFLPFFKSESSFLYSIIFSLAALFLIGALRVIFTKKFWLTSGLEMFFLGALAAAIAYGVGALIKTLVS